MKTSLIHIVSQVKIFGRYQHVTILMISFYVSNAVIGGVLLDEMRHFPALTLLNIPLLCAAVSCFMIGSLFSDLFSGRRNEIRNFGLATWTLRKVVVSKNMVVVLYIILFPLPLWLVIPFFFHTNIQNYLNAGLYLITTLPFLMIFGNRISFSVKVMQSPDFASGVMGCQLLLAFLSPVPYMVLKAWLNSSMLCLVFVFVSVFFWYYRHLPKYEKTFPEQLLKIDFT